VWTTDIQVGARHKARILAEIREARRVAWSQADMELVLKGLKQEAALLKVESLLL
jgi:hypothetical protein